MAVSSGRSMASSPEEARGPGTLHAGRWVGRAALHFALVAGALQAGFPFFWMIMTSFKSRPEAISQPPTLLPQDWQVQNYGIAWRAAPFARYFLNTWFIGACVVLGVLVTSTLAGYAFARLRFPGQRLLFALFIATMMIPFEATIIPNFIIIRTLGWYNTYAALIVPWTASVFSVFLLRQFFHSMPGELLDAAALDGAGRLRTFWSIALPLARAPLGAVALFAFLGSWNSLLWPIIVTGNENIRPIQLGLSVFASSNANQPQLLMAASTFTILPIVALFFATQKLFVEGLASTGMHG